VCVCVQLNSVLLPDLAVPYNLIYFVLVIIIIIGIQPLGRSGQRPEFSQATGMTGMLHPGQVLRGSLPLLSPAF